ncbi:MAG: 4-hydroxy-tetrahydrodipicolinate synthase [Pseudomonadota bacterium]|jgi:4-hydroxy-tetrahydrodipicolinate synthase
MFKGNLVALVTPMYPNGDIDTAGFADLIEWHITEGVEGFIVNGTTGESATTTPEEKVKLLNIAKQQIKGRVPLIAGTGTNSTATSLLLTQEAIAQDVDGCLIVTPFYNKPTQAGLIAHYATLAQNIDRPILLYNVPGRTACDLQPETIASLCRDHRNIVGIKEATGDITRLKQLKTLIDREIAYLSGDDLTALDFMQEGGHGVISVTANVAPKQMRAWCDSAKAGDWKAAETLFTPLIGLHKTLFIESNPIPTKWALHQQGFIQAGIRLPLTWLEPQNAPLVEAALLEARCHGM